MLNVQQLDHLALTVADVGRSARWYAEVLGLERRHADVWGDVPTMMCAGSTCLALFPADVQTPHPPVGNDTIGLRHVAFRVDRATFEAAKSDLEARGIGFSIEDHTISHSIYLHDPDGYRVELTTYELEEQDEIGE
jgi:catechol 2,3-dioxygenase